MEYLEKQKSTSAKYDNSVLCTGNTPVDYIFTVLNHDQAGPIALFFILWMISLTMFLTMYYILEVFFILYFTNCIYKFFIRSKKKIESIKIESIKKIEWIKGLFVRKPEGLN